MHARIADTLHKEMMVDEPTAAGEQMSQDIEAHQDRNNDLQAGDAVTPPVGGPLRTPLSRPHFLRFEQPKESWEIQARTNSAMVGFPLVHGRW